MSTYQVMVEVLLKPGIADPAGATIQRSLPTLGFDDVSGVRTGKVIRLDIDAPNESAALDRVGELCRRFLTNPVIEDFNATISEFTL